MMKSYDFYPVRLRLIHQTSRVIMMMAVLIGSLSVPTIQAAEEVKKEYVVKAAFLYNFAKFVVWPDDQLGEDRGPVTICIVGQDPFGNALEPFQKKTVKGRALSFERVEGLDEIAQCHVLFISSSEKEKLPFILQRIKNRNILSVSDMEGFAEAGGMINLVNRESKVRFQINVDAVGREGLEMSSKLLHLAEIVSDHGRESE